MKTHNRIRTHSNTTHKSATRKIVVRETKKKLRPEKYKHPVTVDWNYIIHPKPDCFVLFFQKKKIIEANRIIARK